LAEPRCYSSRNPWVAAALHQHSNLQIDPLARFHNTFRVVFTMVFGTLEQALSSSCHMYQMHTRIKGRLPESVAAYPQGAPYEANELKAPLWVYATLVESYGSYSRQDSFWLLKTIVSPCILPVLPFVFGLPSTASTSDYV
jgi:uncharacterized protein (DUF2236 family)